MTVSEIENVRRTAEAPPTDRRIPYRGLTRAGVNANADNAMTLSAIWACVRYLSQTVGVLPWRVKQFVGGDGDGALAPRHPVYSLLSRSVSEETTSSRFRETLMAWALRYGNGYAEIERDEAGRPIAMHLLHPLRVDVLRDRETGRLEYLVDGRVTLDAADMFHVAGLGEGPLGLNVAQYAAESIGYARAVQLFGASWFGHGSNPSGVLKVKGQITADGILELERRFREIYAGPSNANKVVVVDDDLDFQTISIEPEKGQFIETNHFLVEEICRWFAVPPHKIYHLLRATFSNIEHQSIEVVVDSVKPWAKRFNDEIDRKLLISPRYFAEMDFYELLRGDSAAQVTFWKGMREMGAANANEIRRRVGMPPIGEQGDKYLVQSQYTTLEQVGVVAEPPPVAPPPAPEPAPTQQLSRAAVARYAAFRAVALARIEHAAR